MSIGTVSVTWERVVLGLRMDGSMTMNFNAI